MAAVSFAMVLALEGCSSSPVSVTKLGWRVPGVVGTVTASSGTTPSISCGDGCITSTANILDRTNLTLKAFKTPGDATSEFFFGGWGGDCASFGTAPECTLLVNSPRTVYAAMYPFIDSTVLGDFTRILNVNIRGPGTISQAYVPVAGSCPGSPPPASCFLLDPSRPTTLRALPNNPSSKFTGWDGCDPPYSEQGQDCTVTAHHPDDDQTPTATFDLPVLRVEIAHVGGGNGSHTYNGNPFEDCFSGACYKRIQMNTSVEVAAIPDATSAFVGWDECSGAQAGATCTVTMDGDKKTVARFNGEFTLTVVKAGNLAGGTLVRTTELQPKIDCGPGCASQSAVYRGGDNIGVLLTAPPSPRPITWTGCTSIGVANSCLVTMPTANLTVTVTVN